MAEGVSVGVISLDLIIANSIQKQIGAIAKSVDRTASKSFEDVGENIGKAISEPLKQVDKALEEPLNHVKKNAAQTAEEILKIAERAQKRMNEAAAVEPESLAPGSGGAVKPSKLASQQIKTPPPAPASERPLEMFKAATDQAGLLEQKLGNVNAQIAEQEAKLQSLLQQYKELSGTKGFDSKQAAETDQKITAVQGRLISLQQAAIQTEAKLKKALDVSPAARKTESAVDRVKNKVQNAAQTARTKVASAAQKAQSSVTNAVDKVHKKASSSFRGLGRGVQGLGKSIKSAFKSAFLMAGLYAAFRGIKQLIGSAALQNKDFAKSLSGIKSNLLVAFAPIMDAIMPALTAMVQGLEKATRAVAAFISGLMGKSYAESADAAKKLQEVQKQANKTQNLASIDQINTISKNKDDNQTDINAAEDGVTIKSAMAAQKMLDTLKSGISGIKEYISTAFAPSISEWGKAFESLKAPATQAFESIKGSISKLWKNTLKPYYGYLVFDWVPGIANGFSKTFAPIFSQVMPVLFSEFAKDIEFSCQQVNRVVKDILQPALGFIKTAALDAFSSVKSAWDEHGAGILSGFTKFKEGLRKIWDSLYTIIFKPVFEEIGKVADDVWNNHLKGLWDNIAGFIGSVGEFILTLWNNILSPVVNWLITVFGPIVTNVFGGVASVVGTVFGIIADVVGGILKTLSGLLDFLTGVFTGDWNKAWEGIKKSFGGIWDAMWGIAKGAINLIIDGINLLWRGIYSAVSGIVNGIGGIAGALGDLFGHNWKFSMPTKPPLIPKLAKGGIVESPTLALIGERGKEAVMPLENNTGWIDRIAEKLIAAGGSGGGDTQITTYVVLDDGTVVGKTTQKISRDNRVSGKPVLGV